MVGVTPKKKEGLLSDIVRAFPRTIPLAISHHPDCPPYDKDVIRIGRVRFCRGCTIAYGLAVSVLVMYLVLPVFRDLFDPFSPGIIMATGAFLGSFQVLRAVFRRMGSTLRSLIKVALGSGIVLVLIGLLRFDLGHLQTFFIGLALFTVYGVLGGMMRYLYMKKTCQECDHKADLTACPGMSFIRDLE